MTEGDLRIVVAFGEDFALFGEPQGAIEGFRWQRKNAAGRWTAAAAERTAPAVEERERDAMVLGSAENGAEDYLIEINPRLTTSYLGLRRACEQNLADAMLRCVRGETLSLSFRNERIEFTPAEQP